MKTIDETVLCIILFIHLTDKYLFQWAYWFAQIKMLWSNRSMFIFTSLVFSLFWFLSTLPSVHNLSPVSSDLLSTPLTPLSCAASVTRFTQTLLYCCLTEFDTETESGGKTQWTVDESPSVGGLALTFIPWTRGQSGEASQQEAGSILLPVWVMKWHLQRRRRPCEQTFPWISKDFFWFG